MSETPRTDAFCDAPIDAEVTGAELAVQWLELTRTLERELAACDAQNKQLRGMVADLPCLLDQLEERQAAIDELVAARHEWAYSEDEGEDERINIAFSVARSLATPKSDTGPS